MICYVLAMEKQHLGPHVVVGYGIKIFWPGLFITSPDHLATNIYFLHSQQICFVLVCIRAGNPRVPPRVLTSGPKPCGGKKKM